MPNLKTDRPIGLAGTLDDWNVRRLIYQSLIWAKLARHHARSLGAPPNTEGLESDADSLVDGMRRDSEFDRDFLGRQVLVDQQEAIELRLAEPGDAANTISCRLVETWIFRWQSAHLIVWQ